MLMLLYLRTQPPITLFSDGVSQASQIVRFGQAPRTFRAVFPLVTVVQRLPRFFNRLLMAQATIND